MFVEFSFESTVLGPTLRSDADVHLQTERTHVGRDNVQRSVFSLPTTDPTTVESVFDWDPTIADATQLHRANDRSVYRVTYADGMPETDGYLEAVDLDGLLLDAYSRDDAWTLQMLFPDHHSFGTFADRCGEFGLDISVDRLRNDGYTPEAGVGLTDAQREALLEALESGYFAVPQETSLSELADDLSLSSSAVSGRLHRGMERLVENALATEKQTRPTGGSDPS